MKMEVTAALMKMRWVRNFHKIRTMAVLVPTTVAAKMEASQTPRKMIHMENMESKVGGRLTIVKIRHIRNLNQLIEAKPAQRDLTMILSHILVILAPRQRKHSLLRTRIRAAPIPVHSLAGLWMTVEAVGVTLTLLKKAVHAQELVATQHLQHQRLAKARHTTAL